jgi:DNA-binding PucR family transcriptional regulator
MAKVREITGLDLTDAAQRFLVQTALFIIGRYP